jgi:hypothetical protein
MDDDFFKPVPYQPPTPPSLAADIVMGLLGGAIQSIGPLFYIAVVVAFMLRC